MPNQNPIRRLGLHSPFASLLPSPLVALPDVLARVLAQSWQESLGVPVLVENRPGFGGNIGAEMVAKSDPDGYTLLIGTVGIHAINGALYEKMSYDPIKDFTPISFLAARPMC